MRSFISMGPNFFEIFEDSPLRGFEVFDARGVGVVGRVGFAPVELFVEQLNLELLLSKGLFHIEKSVARLFECSLTHCRLPNAHLRGAARYKKEEEQQALLFFEHGPYNIR